MIIVHYVHNVMMIFHYVMMIRQKGIMKLHDVMMTLHNIVMVLLCDDDTSLRYDKKLSFFGNFSLYGAGMDPFKNKLTNKQTTRGRGRLRLVYAYY